MAWLRRSFRLCIWIFIFYVVVNFWLRNKSYLIKEKDVVSIAEKNQGPNVKQAFRRIVSDLRQKYPGHILPDEQLQFVFVNAGGWMGSMCVLHASITEYVLFFGTAVDTSGHSGRYWANITDTIVKGTFVQWKEGSLQSEVFTAGQTVRHASGEASAVMWSRDTWMLEYGRGFIPSTLPFAFSDTLFGTQDVYTLVSTLRVYTSALLQELALDLAVANDYVQSTVHKWLKRWI